MDLTHLLADLRLSARQPSLSAAVAVGGALAWAGAVGDADPLGLPRTPTPDTQYRVASITKPQIAVALLTLADAGALDLHRPLATWVPDAPGGAATVAQFLAHTSGLPAEPAGPWWERSGGYAWADLVAMRLPLLAPPGTRFHYSNVGFGVLGRLVETLTGRPWDAAVADLVWTPLGMTRTGRTPQPGHAVGVAVHPDADLVHAEPVPDFLAMGSAGELWSTPTDLARLGSFLAGVGPQGVLRPATLASMRQPIAFEDVLGRPWTAGYGLGVAVENVDGRRLAGHGGSVPGFTCDLRLDPAVGVVAAVCGNSTNPSGGARPLLDAACAEAPAPPRPDPGWPGPLADLAGPWYWGSRVHELAFTGDGLLTLLSPTGGGGRFARDGDAWVGVGGDYFHGERLRIMRDAEGRVRSLDVGTFCFTRIPYDPDVDLPGGDDPRGWVPWR